MRFIVASLVSVIVVTGPSVFADEPAAKPITAVKIAAATWKAGATGVVRVTDSDAKGFVVEVVMPEQEIDGLPDDTMDATVASPGTLDIFDASGLVGTLPIGPMRVKMWCENDGGRQARPTWLGRIERSTLKRALVPNRELQNVAAFVRVAGSNPATPVRLAGPSARVAMKGALTKKGVVTAEILTEPDEASNCDGEPQNNLTIVLRSAHGDFSLRCCGP